MKISMPGRKVWVTRTNNFRVNLLEKKAIALTESFYFDFCFPPEDLHASRLSLLRLGTSLQSCVLTQCWPTAFCYSVSVVLLLFIPPLAFMFAMLRLTSFQIIITCQRRCTCKVPLILSHQGSQAHLLWCPFHVVHKGNLGLWCTLYLSASKIWGDEHLQRWHKMFNTR